MELFAQIIGIFAMAAIVLSYQCKKKNTLLLIQLVGNVLFAANMLMLGAYVGGLLNVIAIGRAIVYMKKEQIKLPTWVLNASFIFLYIVSYVLVFTVFGKEFTVINAILEMLPVIGMTALTFGCAGTNAKAIRLCGLINSPCWLIYNSVSFSIGGILCEIISLVSLATAMIRLDLKKNKTKA